MRCERCQKEDKQIKAGKTRAGSQIYKCKHCGKTYTPKPKERNYSEEVKKQAIKLCMEGNSGRGVWRILGISKNTCLHWIRKYAKKIEKKNSSNERVKVIEMDGLYTYTERKNKIYMITPVNREKRQIECFFRSIETAKAVFKIFVFAFNKFALVKFLHPSLKASFSLSCFL